MLLSFVIAASLAHAVEPGEMTEQALDRVEERYLDFADLEPSGVLAKAAEAAEDAIPWLIVEPTDDGVLLRHGEDGVIGQVSLPTGEFEELPTALAEIAARISRASAPVPEDVDVEFELLRGMTRALDKHSILLSGERLARFDERIKGKLTGIGARIGLVEGQQIIKAVFPSGPAQSGGLRAGDVLLAVDGFSTTGLSVARVVERIRGPEGSRVQLTIARPGSTGPQELTLSFERAEVIIPNVTWHVEPDDIGIIAIDSFSEQTVHLLRDALADMRREGAVGLVVDVRGNSGGSMSQACRSVDLFLERGLVLRTAGRGGAPVDNLLHEYFAHPEEEDTELPVVVLMDHRSASAAEIFAGALMLLDRAVLIGERSHGKGTVQRLFTIRRGNGQRVRFKLTVAEYLLPHDVSIKDSDGLVPDVWVRRAVFRRSGAALPRPLREGDEVVTVDEREGWREDITLDDPPDVPIELARRAVQRTAAPDRSSMLRALSEAAEVTRDEQGLLLAETFAMRGIDWSPGPDAAAAPQLKVRVEVLGEPIAGGDVEVRAVVENLGETTAHRVRVELRTDARLPWKRVTLPVGRLEPGERGLGSSLVTIDPNLPSREDTVEVSVFADGLTVRDEDPVVLSIISRERSPLPVTAALVPHEGGHRVQIELENPDDAPLRDLHAQLTFPRDSTVVQRDREGLLDALDGGETGRIDMELDLGDPLPRAPLELQLHLKTAREGRLVTLPFTLPIDGTPVARRGPRIDARPPSATETGVMNLRVRATDDTALASATVWYAGEKVAWRSGSGNRLSFTVPLEIIEGPRTLDIEARDADDVVTRHRWSIRGLPPGERDAADATGE